MERNKTKKTDKKEKEGNKKIEKEEKTIHETTTKQTPKKDSAKNVLKAFIDEIQSISIPKEDANEDANELKISDELNKLCQLTWHETKQPKEPVFAHLAVNVLVGNVGIKIRKILSENCDIYQVTTNTGRYSCKVICETEIYKPSKDGVWGVNPLSFHKLS